MTLEERVAVVEEMLAADEVRTASDDALDHFLEAARLIPREKIMREARAGKTGKTNPYREGYERADAEWRRKLRRFDQKERLEMMGQAA